MKTYIKGGTKYFLVDDTHGHFVWRGEKYEFNPSGILHKIAEQASLARSKANFYTGRNTAEADARYNDRIERILRRIENNPCFLQERWVDKLRKAIKTGTYLRNYRYSKGESHEHALAVIER